MTRKARRGGRLRVVALVALGVTALAGCGGSTTAERTTSTTAAKTTFCEAYPRFAAELNAALAGANPDVRQYTVVGSILAQLGPTIAQLRAAEPAALKGTVESWVSNMQKYASGDYPVTAAEADRAKMADWVKANC